MPSGVTKSKTSIFTALGVPRNRALAVNRDPAYFDLGLCGPVRSDLKSQKQYCGMFATRTLRNVATRHAFFHNGVYRALRKVLAFYEFRDVAPGRVYPRDAAGTVERYDDLPAHDRANVDHVNAPFDRPAGTPPAMNDAEMRDVIAFLGTLTVGYRPAAWQGNGTGGRSVAASARNRR